MTKHPVSMLLLLVALALVATACSAPPTATPVPVPTARPTVPPTQPPPTVAPTPVPPTPTKVPTLAPTATVPPTIAPTATPSTPSPTPTRTRAPATLAPARTATPTALKLPAPKGSVGYHVSDGGIDRIRILNLATNVTTPFVDTGPVMDVALGTNAPLGAFSPDNSRFAYIQVTASGGANNLKVLDLRDPDPNSNTHGLFSDAGLSSPTWSPDGRRIAFIRMNTNQQFWGISVINADGTGSITDLFTNRSGQSFRGGLAWSKQNLFAYAQNTTGASDVFKMFSDGGGSTNLTNNPSDDSTPTWSPDGKFIAFTSNRDGRSQIYIMNADGSGARRVSQSNANDVQPAWSPDGNWIAFVSGRDNPHGDVYLMDTRGGNLKRLTTSGGDHPFWSY